MDITRLNKEIDSRIKKLSINPESDEAHIEEAKKHHGEESGIKWKLEWDGQYYIPYVAENYVWKSHRDQGSESANAAGLSAKWICREIAGKKK